MDFNKTLYLLKEANEYFIKDALDKAISGDKLTADERTKLVKLGLLDIKGNTTSKAKEEYSELFD